MRDVVILDGVRTPIGRYAGALRAVRPDDLAAHVVQSLVRRNTVAPGELEDVIVGCANQAGEDNRNVARMAAAARCWLSQANRSWSSREIEYRSATFSAVSPML